MPPLLLHGLSFRRSQNSYSYSSLLSPTVKTRTKGFVLRRYTFSPVWSLLCVGPFVFAEEAASLEADGQTTVSPADNEAVCKPDIGEWRQGWRGRGIPGLLPWQRGERAGPPRGCPHYGAAPPPSQGLWGDSNEWEELLTPAWPPPARGRRQQCCAGGKWCLLSTEKATAADGRCAAGASSLSGKTFLRSICLPRQALAVTTEF